LRDARVIVIAARFIFRRATQYHSRSLAMWTKPAAADLRFGFEITMYIAAR
jgi:coenzyme PQQ precursor peptide PqqA